MKEQYIFIPPGDNLQVGPYEADIAAAYKIAFAGDPWYERTKCVDAKQRCPGGLSPVNIGEECGRCGLAMLQDAYDEAELIGRWREVGQARPAAWYLEVVEGQVALAGFFWRANASLLAREKYPDVPAMEPWLEQRFGTQPFIWLDEMFANKAVRGRANLERFGTVVNTAEDIFGLDRIAYRTITPQMKRAAQKIGTTPLQAFVEVPDRRDFIDIEGRR